MVENALAVKGGIPVFEEVLHNVVLDLSKVDDLPVFGDGSALGVNGEGTRGKLAVLLFL